MQLENVDTSITPPTSASPIREEAQSPEGQASSFSSGSSDNVNGNEASFFSRHNKII